MTEHIREKVDDRSQLLQLIDQLNISCEATLLINKTAVQLIAEERER